MQFIEWLKDEECIVHVSYLVGIFEQQQNKLNLLMQGRNTKIIKLVDALKAVKNKLDNWKRKVNTKNAAMLEKLSSILDVCGEDKELQQFTNNELLRHFTPLENEFDRYFPELSDDDLKLV